MHYLLPIYLTINLVNYYYTNLQLLVVWLRLALSLEVKNTDRKFLRLKCCGQYLG